MFKWIAKKFLLKQVNGILDDKGNNIQNTKSKVELWIGRIEKILACLKSILSYLDDNKIEADEVEKGVNDIKVVIDNW